MNNYQLLKLVGDTLIKLENLEFFNPSPLYRELLLLSSIEKDPNISQEKLSKIANIAPSMVNKYIKLFVEEGYIEKSGDNARTMSYHLTLIGKNRLQLLTLSLMAEISQLFMETKGHFSKIVEILNREKKRQILLYGAGVIGRIVLNVLKAEDFEILGFIDDSPLKQGDRMYGYNVYEPEHAIKISHDAVIIASFKHSKVMLEKAKKLGYESVYVFNVSENGTVSLERS
ncbi:MAG: hypothetical protein PWQ20_968 [Thermotogaceae bacterium]|nr:hypothetical protein [Thermotogaceae bacterium]MDN5337898.1 hypothetical protein [Thermotogaceae bacterium]